MSDEIPMSPESEEVVLASDEAPQNGAEALRSAMDEQDAEAQKFAMDFLMKALRLRGVKIERDAYLRQELRKIGVSDALTDAAIAGSPIEAGISGTQLDVIAKSTIDFETRKSAAMSFATGLPGGFAMFATIPADVTQYYVHAFRVMQKLAYLYGWKDFLGELDEADDETIGTVTVFLGVMLGVGGASASLVAFAQQVARPAIQKQITKQALTKTAWYPVIKQTLKVVGISVTKDSFAQTVTKAVPVVGGVVSGGMTLVALSGQSHRLHSHLRELPPPGSDGEAYLAALKAIEAEDDAEESGIKSAASSVVTGAKSAASNAATGAKDLAGTAAGKAKGATASLLRKGLRRLGADEAPVESDAPADD